MTWLKRSLHRESRSEPASAVPPVEFVPRNLPVHQPEALAKLADELPNREDALRYRDNFARLLPERLERLAMGLRARDYEVATSTLLTLKVGSTMVGAPRLQHVVRQCLADYEHDSTVPLLPALRREAETFLAYLADERPGR